MARDRQDCSSTTVSVASASSTRNWGAAGEAALSASLASKLGLLSQEMGRSSVPPAVRRDRSLLGPPPSELLNASSDSFLMADAVRDFVLGRRSDDSLLSELDPLRSILSGLAPSAPPVDGRALSSFGLD